VAYWALITVKNGERTIRESLESVFSQTVRPSLVCVVDDGSTDSTPAILGKLKDVNPSLRVLTLPDKGYDIRRIVHNWNEACRYVQSLGLEFDFILISSDDIVFPPNYVQSLISEMERNPKLAIASGTRGLRQSDYMSFPEGAGRLIKDSFFRRIGYSHPPYYGYEPWILYKALQMGYDIKKFQNIRYGHERTFGIGHNFIEYGPAMKCLGYHPLFVLARVVRNLAMPKKTGISRRASLRMIGDYLFDSRWKNDPYYRYFEPELRKFVHSLQRKRLLAKLG